MEPIEDELTKQLEYIFLKKIIAGLRDESLSVEDAKMLANEFLDLEPFLNEADATTKMEQFVANHREFFALKSYMDALEEEKAVSEKVDLMREQLKQNNVDEALQIAKT